MKLSKRTALLVSLGCSLVISTVIAITNLGTFQTQNTSGSSSTVENGDLGHDTRSPSSLRADAMFQADYSVALSEYHYLDDDTVFLIIVSRDSTRTWALVRVYSTLFGSAFEYLHLGGRQIVRLGIGSAGPCPALKAVCDSLSTGTKFVVNHVGNSVVLQKPIKVSISYAVRGSSCAEVGISDGAYAFAFTPQHHMDIYKGDTLTATDSKSQTSQGTTVPTCTLALPGTIDWVSNGLNPLTICILTSSGYIGGDAKFDHSISPTRAVYSYVNSDPIEAGGLSYAQSCGGSSA